eukprot:738281-Amphidinium_carterae.1
MRPWRDGCVMSSTRCCPAPLPTSLAFSRPLRASPKEARSLPCCSRLPWPVWSGPSGNAWWTPRAAPLWIFASTSASG